MQIEQCQKVDGGERVWSIDWHPQSNILISAGSNKTITLWKWDNNNLTKGSTITTEHTKTIRSVKFSHKGDKIAAGSFDSTISVWVFNNENQQYEMLSTLEGHQNQVKCVSWALGDTKIASCSRDKNIWVWEFDNISYDYVCEAVLEGHTQDVKFVEWFKGQSKLVSCSYDNTIKIWEAQDDDYICKQTLQGHQSIVWNVQILHPYLYSCSEDCCLIKWLYNEQNEKYQIMSIFTGMHSLPIYTLCILNEKYIMSGSADNSICVVNTQQGELNKHKEQKIVKPQIAYKLWHESDVNSITKNPNNPNTIATCSDDETIRIWNIKYK